MQIVINYESSWRNSFLDGDNNEPTPKGGRYFIGSMTELEKDENYLERQVTKDTVMGLLNLLIGDNRRLYQSRQSVDYHFKEMEDKISFIDDVSVLNEEVVFLRNLKGNSDRNSFSGMLKASNPIFTSNYSREFWGVLALDIEQLCDFILNNKSVLDSTIDKPIELSPMAIVKQFAVIGKTPPKPCEGDLKLATEVLSEQFEKYNPTNKAGKVIISSIYATALYLQQKRLSNRFDMTSSYAKKGGITGISHNNITASDFLKAYSTGKGKLVYGNPYIQTKKVKGEGKISRKLKKASGQLIINLDISFKEAEKLINMIDCAGVSSFRLGKKGLAYVYDMSI